MTNLKPARSASHAQGACVSRLSRRAIQRRWRKPCALQSAHVSWLRGRAVCGERVLSATEQYLLLAFFGRQLFGERPLCADFVAEIGIPTARDGWCIF